MWEYLRFRMNFTVILHETSHIIGERLRQVQLQDAVLAAPHRQRQEQAMCKGPVKDGANCIGPRNYDPLTQDEIDNSIWT